MNVADWLRLLNGFVFFTSSDRLQALRSAYRTTPAVLLTVRTQSLVQEHGARVRLAGMNTGNTSRRVKERGASTFLPIRRYDLRARVQEVAGWTRCPTYGTTCYRRSCFPPTTEVHRQLQHRHAVPRHRDHGAAVLSVRPDRARTGPVRGPQPCCACSVSPLGRGVGPYLHCGLLLTVSAGWPTLVICKAARLRHPYDQVN
jgi:hypothetical protein